MRPSAAVSLCAESYALSAVIVDDEQLARDELAYLVRVLPMSTSLPRQNGLEAVNLIREHSPDLVFLDVQMPGLDGFGVIKKLLDARLFFPSLFLPLPLISTPSRHLR